MSTGRTRCLHYAPPDFLSRFVALMISMRLSLHGEPHTRSSLAARSRKSGSALPKNIPKKGPLNRRSLHCAALRSR